MSAVQQNNTVNSNGAIIYDLNAFKDDPFKHGFIAATAAYISGILNMQSNQVSNTQVLSNIESKIMNSYTESSRQQAKQIAQQEEAEQAAEHSSGLLGEIVGYLMDAIMIVGGIITADPYMVGMGSLALSMQASGLQDKLDSALPSDAGLKALCEMGIAVGETLAFGGIGISAEAKLTDGGLQAMAETAETTAGKLVTFRLISTLMQGFMLNNVWTDLMTKAGASPETAAGLSILLGLSTCALASIASSTFGGESSLQNLVNGKILAKLGDENFQYYEKALMGLKALSSAAGVAGGAMKMVQGKYQMEEAGILSDLGVLQKYYTILQGVIQQSQQAVTITQDGASSTNKAFVDIAETYPALAQMWAQPRKT